MSEIYTVHRAEEPTRKPWVLSKKPDEDRVAFRIATYETKREAVKTARLLAGRTGKVRVFN